MATVHSFFGQVSYGDPTVLLNDGDEVDLSDAETAKYIAALESAGAIKVDCTDEEREALTPHVQSQEDGEVALQLAINSGEWQAGNKALYESGASGFGLQELPVDEEGEQA